MKKKTEIERRFLLVGSVPAISVIKREKITQGYLSTVPERTIRIRLVECKGEESIAFLTVKGKTENFTRREIETEIGVDEATQLLNEFCDGNLIVKTRLSVLTPRELSPDRLQSARSHNKGDLWHIDLFEGILLGLNIAEIELDSEDQQFVKPSWVGEEITHDYRYSNSALSTAVPNLYVSQQSSTLTRSTGPR